MLMSLMFSRDSVRWVRRASSLRLALEGSGGNRRDVADELQVAHAVVGALRAENQQNHCRETVAFKLVLPKGIHMT